MYNRSQNRPGEDTIARILDWIGLAFGVSVILFVAEFTFIPV